MPFQNSPTRRFFLNLFCLSFTGLIPTQNPLRRINSIKGIFYCNSFPGFCIIILLQTCRIQKFYLQLDLQSVLHQLNFLKLLDLALSHDIFDPFPLDKILDQTKLTAFADDKCNKNDNFCL